MIGSVHLFGTVDCYDHIVIQFSLLECVFFVCDHVVCVENLSFMYVLVCECSGRSVCHQCLTVQLLSRVLWTSLAAITSALVQWTAATIHCAGVMYYYHSQCCFFLSVIMLCVYRICHVCTYLSVGALVEVSAISV